jgi:hypothetical protein
VKLLSNIPDGTNSKALAVDTNGNLIQVPVGGGVTITSSTSAPSSPNVGDLWLDTDDNVGSAIIPVLTSEPTTPSEGAVLYFINGDLKVKTRDGVVTVLVQGPYTNIHHFDNSLVDTLGGTWTASGGAVLSASQSKFGGYSLSCPNSGAYCTSPTSASNSQAAVFTFEFFVYNVNAYVLAYVGSWGGDFFGIQANAAVANSPIGFQASGFTNSTSGLPTTQWAHVALTRDENSIWRLWLDGTQIATKTQSGTYGGASSVITLGGGAAGAGGVCFFDEIRLVKGVCKYTGTFTPPSAPFTTA